MVFNRSINKFTYEYNENKDFINIITEINAFDNTITNKVKIEESIKEVTKKINTYFLSEKANTDIIPDIFKKNKEKKKLNEKIKKFFKKNKK